MAKELVKVSKVIDGNKVTGEAQYDFGGDLQGAIALFGDKVVYEVFKDGAMVKVQNPLRRLLEAQATAQEIQDYADSYKLGQGGTRIVDPVKAFMSKYEGMSAEEQMDMLKKLKAAQAGK